MHFPESLLKELQNNFSVDTTAFLEAHKKTVPVSVRLNPLKADRTFLLDKQVPWTGNAFYLKERPVFTNDPLFHAGCYYVQEASSMFVEQAVKQTVDTNKKLMVLDACAAPGGKSTLLASLLNEESLLVSNEVISTRVPVLVHNMVKWGTVNSVVSNNDPKDFSRLADFFDVMVVDAPCSGSGLFRKQEDAIEHWSEENVKHCSLRQQRILHDLIPSLKENGILIYSTCSYSEAENENVCDKIVSEFGLETVQIELEAGWGIVESKSKNGAFGYRFFPHLLQGEGFFLACFRKVNVSPSPADGGKVRVRSISHSKNPAGKISSTESKALEEFISGNFEFAKQGEELVGYHTSVSEEIKALATLKLKKMPLHIGQIKGKDFIPHAYSAYLDCLSQKNSKTELDKDSALKFLRKQNFEMQGERGFTLMTHRSYGLGWVKNLGNRINNYYPAEWRILKEIV